MCKTAKAWVAVTLAEALAGHAATMYALNLLQIFNSDWLAQPFVQGQPLATQLKMVTDRACRLGLHFVEVTLVFQRWLSR